MTLITINHARQCNYCTSGIRLFCEKYKIDLKTFLKSGIESQELMKLDSHLVKNIIKKAEEK